MPPGCAMCGQSTDDLLILIGTKNKPGIYRELQSHTATGFKKEKMLRPRTCLWVHSIIFPLSVSSSFHAAKTQLDCEQSKNFPVMKTENSCLMCKKTFTAKLRRPLRNRFMIFDLRWLDYVSTLFACVNDQLPPEAVQITNLNTLCLHWLFLPINNYLAAFYLRNHNWNHILKPR